MKKSQKIIIIKILKMTKKRKMIKKMKKRRKLYINKEFHQQINYHGKEIKKKKTIHPNIVIIFLLLKIIILIILKLRNLTIKEKQIKKII